MTQKMQDLAYEFVRLAREAGNVDARINFSEDSEYAWTMYAIDAEGISHMVFGPEVDDEGQ